MGLKSQLLGSIMSARMRSAAILALCSCPLVRTSLLSTLTNGASDASPVTPWLAQSIHSLNVLAFYTNFTYSVLLGWDGLSAKLPMPLRSVLLLSCRNCCGIAFFLKCTQKFICCCLILFELLVIFILDNCFLSVCKDKGGNL